MPLFNYSKLLIFKGHPHTHLVYKPLLLPFSFVLSIVTGVRSGFKCPAHNLHGIMLAVFTCLMLLTGQLNAHNTSFPDSIAVKSALDEIGKSVSLPYSSAVYYHITQKLQNDNRNLASTIAQYKEYENLFILELEKKKLPEELKFIPFAISGMGNHNSHDFSRAGVWALPVSVGVKYGLEISPFIDERLDIQKSTLAAVSYLADLNAIYQDWWKTIIAYCSGPSNLHRAYIRNGFSEIGFEEMPPSVSLYFNAIKNEFISAAYLCSYYKLLNLETNPVGSPDVEFVQIKNDIDARVLSEKLSISESVFFKINPVYLSRFIPSLPDKKIALPAGKAQDFLNLEDSIYAWSKSFTVSMAGNPIDYTHGHLVYADSLIKIKIPEAQAGKSILSTTELSASQNKITYRVKSGDVLGKIAEKHGVGLSQIKKWNHLKSDKIYAGQKLIIYSKSAKNTVQAVGPKKKQGNDKEGQVIKYTVKQGDTLWSIASGYEGVSDEDLRQWNNISNHIQPGQVLIIKLKSH